MQGLRDDVRVVRLRVVLAARISINQPKGGRERIQIAGVGHAAEATRARPVAITQDVAGKTFKELAGDFTPDGKLSTAGLKAYADQLPTLGIAKTVPAESSYYDSAFA
ncbi:hypothetical protein ACIA5D_48155 [Actinoplanes sp. NPDC051513]|uniref:hypothetical protein n=1 Tax=Actinoplanes sp. NPDC051513 TaxID=3363908 RepID=UPI0037AE4787